MSSEIEPIHCAKCGAICVPSGCTTGYGVTDTGDKICFVCCAENDKQYMRDKGRITLYVSGENTSGGCVVTNWPGSLKIPARYSKGKHNIGRTRTDVWFTFEGQSWHGVNIGENNQLCRCKQLKSKG